MEKRNISFSPPDITDAEIEEVSKVLRSGWITTGPRTKKLENRLAQYCNTNKVVCLNSATAAEELNLRILGIGEGDEVIVPAYTYTATAAAVIHVGAKVIFIDSQIDNAEMDYIALEKAITEKTKAIVAVDLGGIICDYNRIFEIVEKKKKLFRACNDIQKAIGRVAVLADCAHALGASKDGKMAGEIADFTSFSFHAVKNFTTAEGGASTWKTIDGIDDEMLYKQYQLYSLHGQSKDALAKNQLGSWEYDIVGPWYKCNMTDIMAAIGLAQLERYPGLLERRREIINRYNDAFKDCPVSVVPHYTDEHMSSGHLYLVRINDATIEQRNELIERMAEKGVATNVHYKPIPMHTAYKKLGFTIDDYPNAYDQFKNEITLPLHTLLTDEEVQYIIEQFKRIITEC